MSLPADVTRCLGEGSAGYRCPKRDDCRRYREREATDGQRLRYAALICRFSDYESRIPMKREAE